ncbi:uncharacterized protein EV422DRAFT_211601 [Fimicolochytrium jonesii]|uniref:uncharacterized protein n=1 Tax=Fimicolochytrium jonesii TaxID=1396493 RepID=UPI0022FE0D88|nr:uncharacterized protein EV422DRAFT_211601 [Fimicolochytrium jonesii]KAI8817674.1 hypothetical protein EV422DRAFT_211601 [Fimicolochytrium jonesii]
MHQPPSETETSPLLRTPSHTPHHRHPPTPLRTTKRLTRIHPRSSSPRTLALIALTVSAWVLAARMVVVVRDLYAVWAPTGGEPTTEVGEGYRYYCNLSEYPVLPSPALPSNKSTSPSHRLTTAGLTLLSMLRTTTYTHTSRINPHLGAFHTDCSCLLSYLLHSGGLDSQFEDIPKERGDARVRPVMPRAREFAGFLRGLLADSGGEGKGGRWRAVEDMWDVRAGDLVAWEIPDWQGMNKSTGHVVVVVPAESALDATREDGRLGMQDREYDDRVIRPVSATSMWVSVMDASGVAHEGDSRCASPSHILTRETQEEMEMVTVLGDTSLPPPSTSTTCIKGVGRGFIRLYGEVVSDSEGKQRPVAFQFREGATVRYYPIFIGRVV